ncbi:MAG TPA: CpsB/CapC family capsule biosynthesis tyrosine phosphatase [Longimicrobiaceae bacterium]
MIDFHNHLVPGVDDGAEDLEQSRAALKAFREQGVTTVVTTPHARASLAARPEELEAFGARVGAAWESLRAMAAAEFPDVRLEPGAEVMLDVPSADLSDPRLRLAGTRFALVEFAYMAVPPNAAQVLFAVSVAGWRPVLAHPERYPGGAAAAEEWCRSGALLQVNAASLAGRYGEEPRRAAREILSRGLASYVASDYHARGNPRLTEFRELLEGEGASEHVTLLLETNPALLLQDEPPLPVPPLPEPRRRSFFGRLFARGG